jgi:NNP family nitrate/nitrite transporter-like MFS transporter
VAVDSCLALAFAVWMLWSVVVVHLPSAGFRYSTNQLFWLTALPALCGATLRIFYAFAVPMIGGRRFTTLATASLLLPAVGIGLAVQDPNTPFEWMVVLALLCGLGGGNFASSMANISFFFPSSRQGTALGLNAGLGHLGVALVQMLVPLAISAGVFGVFAGPAQPTAQGPMWLQNAGFIWVPLILASTAAAWFGMDDLADKHAGMAEQAVIFTRKHNWLMCWLYLGTFGSFIGFSASLPMLAQSQFQRSDALHLVWLGPLIGAVLRPWGAGWPTTGAARASPSGSS